jgi:hypothetical protein
MATPRRREENYLKLVDLTKCCPEAQSDGVPCPTLGRSCEVCERAVASTGEAPPTPIRPAGND